MALLTELKRRRVFRVAGVYGVTAWIITEVSATVLPALNLPEELITIIVVLLIAGFPIALVLAWIFDINPDGIHRTQSTPEVTAAVHSTKGRLASIGLIVLATSVLASLFFWRFSDSEQIPLDSIAVLPFVNLGSDDNSDYFSDGVSEELLNLLTKVPGLKVAARTSSFAYKNQGIDIRDIAAQLGVATVLEGSVRWSDDREEVRITAQLIDASSGYHLWSETYDRKLEDIFAVQDEIARSIVTNLQIQLTGVEAFSITAPPTRDAAAYTLYLRGRALWKQRGLEAIEESVELFQAALARDPGFSRAYSNLAA
ncbi:MAG: adenylyl cyclase, partial [Gammaproteobacteria bacterium]|nr:adenylyl cyclase [Gammaproteobacteria bacterium]